MLCDVSKRKIMEISGLHALVNTREEMGRMEGNETSEFQMMSNEIQVTFY